jgi:hypothetical protein
MQKKFITTEKRREAKENQQQRSQCESRFPVNTAPVCQPDIPSAVLAAKEHAMTTPAFSRMSSLSRVVARDGYCVEVRIHEDGEAAWLLQIVDDQGCLTGWIESFVTDQAAFDEAMRAIEEEGITSFIGSVSGNLPWPANEYRPASRIQRCKVTHNPGMSDRAG